MFFLKKEIKDLFLKIKKIEINKTKLKKSDVSIQPGLLVCPGWDMLLLLTYFCLTGQSDPTRFLLTNWKKWTEPK